MSDYRHGAFFNEVPTSLMTPSPVDSALPVVIGSAPVHNLPGGVKAPINEPRLIYSFEDYVAQFGALKDGESPHDYTLTEFASVYLGRYRVAPVVFINVLDPSKHLEVGAVKSADIIGGIDSATGKRTGLKLVDKVFPLFRKVPGNILAPGFSADPAVAIAIGASCKNVSGHFRCTGIADLPDDIVRPEDVPGYVNANNLTDGNLMLFFGKPAFNNALEHGSTHLAGVIGQRDDETGGIPFWSPSNKRLLCQGLTQNGQELALLPTQASMLNGNGVVTGLNMIGGLVAWGDQTACYPGITDVKDASIPVRRMFNFIGNTLVLTAWQRVSNPLRRRLIRSVCDTFNIWLNGLTAREFILGGRVVFEEKDNPATDLMAGIARFHVYVTPPTAAREIVFTLEYDPSYLQTLFEEA